MKNFLNQYRAALTPLQLVRLEALFFGMADGSAMRDKCPMIPGYGGGQWESVKVGNVWAALIPGKGNGPVTLNNTMAGGSVTTDRKTASVAFTMLVNNWVWNMWAEKGELSHAAHLAFETVYHGLRDGAYADDSGLDYTALFDFTD